jgi:tRNA threonylcarbamoyladenosine biosynthesis protein TsaB
MQNTYILNIETTTKNCSVSLSLNHKLIALEEVNDENYSHAENLHPFIDKVLKQSEVDYSSLSAIAVSKGPGSYTGLRIGVSAAKGLCFALDIPLISIDTLESLAHCVSTQDGVIIPLLDARRMEVYQSVFSCDYKQIQPTKAQVVETDTYKHFLEKQKVHFVGDAVDKVQTLISHTNALFIPNKLPSAQQMPLLSFRKYQANDFEDIAYFEPYYLKDFIAIKSTKKYF